MNRTFVADELAKIARELMGSPKTVEEAVDTAKFLLRRIENYRDEAR
jgi:hypothetical protein